MRHAQESFRELCVKAALGDRIATGQFRREYEPLLAIIARRTMEYPEGAATAPERLQRAGAGMTEIDSGRPAAAGRVERLARRLGRAVLQRFRGRRMDGMETTPAIGPSFTFRA